MEGREKISDAKLSELKINPGKTLQILADFLVNRVDRHGFTGVVLGFSGGIDSAVSAAIAARALGPERVAGIFMPYSQSDPRSEKDAELLARQLDIELIKEPLTPFADSFFAAIPTEDRTRKGNVLARLRMIVLFNWSHKNNRLVLGTSNKTEILLGYGTWYGDTACSLNAIGDLYKTQVRQLASYLKIPQSILDKTPTADLWPGQTDEGEIGMSYDEMDGILNRLHDKEMSPQEIQQEGFEPELIQRVAGLVKANRFKSLPPEIARLDNPE